MAAVDVPAVRRAFGPQRRPSRLQAFRQPVPGRCRHVDNAITRGKCYVKVLCMCFHQNTVVALSMLLIVIMRPSSLGGGRILCRTLSVCLSVRPVIVTERHVAPPSELQWHTHVLFARAEGRISYGHLGRTNSCLKIIIIFPFFLWTLPNTNKDWLIDWFLCY